ncbi:hypothetical protein ACWGCW_29450 [Streptomyces sp. NPDC054933]
MSDDVRNIILGLAASALSAGFGWFVRTYVWRRRLRRKQRFFGLPAGSECLLVVNRDMKAEGDSSVSRHDAFALMELAAVVRECGAHAEILPHDLGKQGFGVRTEFCVGGPSSNVRTAAHLRSMLPGVTVNSGAELGSDQGAFTIGGKTYRKEKGVVEYVLLARLTAGKGAGNDRPVFLACGQRGIANQAAVRYLARHHDRLARGHGTDATFCLLLKVVNSDAYGPDMAELVADVTRAATTAPVATA